MNMPSNTIILPSRCHAYDGPEWVPEREALADTLVFMHRFAVDAPSPIAHHSDSIIETFIRRNVYRFGVGLVARALRCSDFVVRSYARKHRLTIAKPTTGQRYQRRADLCQRAWEPHMITYRRK